MYPYIHITLPSYGVFAFMGGFFAIVFLFFKKDKYEIEFLEFVKIFIMALIGGFVGSKVLFALTRIPWLVENFTIGNLLMWIPGSGYVYYGGLFGVLIALWIVTRKDINKQSKVFRLIIPAIPLFHGFGRIGCMMAGCCYGIELTNHIYIGGIEFDRVPVQLIEAGFEFLLFVVFSLLERYDAKVYKLDNYLLLYAVFRFVIEFFRGDAIRGIWAFGLSTAQIISITIVVLVMLKNCKNNINRMYDIADESSALEKNEV